MAFKRTVAVASALTLVALIGVLYVSFGGQQQPISQDSHMVRRNQAAYVRCREGCMKYQNLKQRNSCFMPCERNYALVQIKETNKSETVVAGQDSHLVRRNQAAYVKCRQGCMKYQNLKQRNSCFMPCERNYALVQTKETHLISKERSRCINRC